MKKLALFSLIALLGVSCSKNNTFFSEVDVNDFDQKIEKPTVEKVDDYLVFRDWQTFEEIMYDLGDKTREEVVQWEKGLDFESMRSVYEKADEELGAITDVADIDEFKSKYTGKIKMIEDEDREKSIEPLVSVPALLPLLNSEGILMIDNIIHQFLPDGRLIMIGNGDFSKLDEAVNMTTSDEENHIFITRVYEEIENLRKDFSLTRTTYHNGTSSSNRRMRSYLKLSTWASPIYSNAVFTNKWNTGWSLSMEVKNERRRIWWAGNRANLRITGGFNVTCNVLAGNLNTPSFNATANNQSSLTRSFGKATGVTNLNLVGAFFPTTTATTYNIRYASNEVSRTTTFVK